MNKLLLNLYKHPLKLNDQWEIEALDNVKTAKFNNHHHFLSNKLFSHMLKSFEYHISNVTYPRDSTGKHKITQLLIIVEKSFSVSIISRNESDRIKNVYKNE